MARNSLKNDKGGSLNAQFQYSLPINAYPKVRLSKIVLLDGSFPIDKKKNTIHYSIISV